MDKIIFLDIDGVLCTFQQYQLSKFNKKYNTRVYPFKKECVKWLNKILEQTNAKIVLSSSWRKLFSREHLQDIFKKNGVNALVSDVTNGRGGAIYESQRASEIQNWLDSHDKCKYCVIDDLDLRAWFKDNFVWTSEIMGLNEDLADKAIKILN